MLFFSRVSFALRYRMCARAFEGSAVSTDQPTFGIGVLLGIGVAHASGLD